MPRPHRSLAGLTVAFLALGGGGAALADGPAPRDATLATLVDEALAARPELAQALAEVRAARERVPQARALADPMLQVGVQNDGFRSWEVGKMETSWISFMASQTIPLSDRLGLRGELAESDVRQRSLALERLRLTTVADVQRAYLGLQLARERLQLLEKLAAVWEKSIAVAQSRYETGDGAQSDLLRARLELARLQQRRRLQQVDERLQAQALNRLRHKPLDQRVETARRLTELDFPQPPEEAAALAAARDRSPELLSSRTGLQRAGRAKDLALRAWVPDLSVGVGVMVRGPLDPMWTVTLGVPVPVYGGLKQGRGVAEAGALAEAAGQDVETVEQLLALRIHQRLDAWRTQQDVWLATRDLLVQAEATAESTLGQYRVGKVSFASVLEANATSIAEADAALQVLADGWRFAIAQDEVSLAEVGLSSSSAGSAGMPGAGATSSSSSRMSASSASDPGAGAAASTGM